MEGAEAAAPPESLKSSVGEQPTDGGGTPVVYACETCRACERVRAACERLGSLTPAPDAALLPPCPLPPQPPHYLVTQPFAGDLFDAAHRAKYRVLGPTAVLQLAERAESAPSGARPLYSLAMRGAVICFTGFRKKDELTYLITLIHYMGGSIRKDMSAKVTHLIANAAGGDKYRYASAFRLPVLARSWVDACWQRRDDPECCATSDAFINEHRLKVFAGARVCFVGFAEDESQHMAEVLVKNGGEVCAVDDPTCTHVVMAHGESFGHSLVLSPHCLATSSPPKRITPTRSQSHSQSTPKTSLYRRLSARLSGCRDSFSKHSPDQSESESTNNQRESKLQRARDKVRRESKSKATTADDVDSACSPSDLQLTLIADESSVNMKHGITTAIVEKENIGRRSSISKENKSNKSAKEKREVFKNKTINVIDALDSVSQNTNSIRSPLVKSLCELDSKDCDIFLPSLRSASEFQESTTTISSGKKRSRNSADSNILVSAVDENLSPDKCEEGTWKAIKRLKIKDSFKFKTKPTIFKREKKSDKTGVGKMAGDLTVEPVSPEASRPSEPALAYPDSSMSPYKDDDNTSICSMNTSKQSGFFDISFASIRQSKTIKSASKLRRSVKSFTASFRSERKKKYERRTESGDIVNMSTPKRGLNDLSLDLSPVDTDTVDYSLASTPRGLEQRAPSPLLFKTPQPPPPTPPLRHSVCGFLAPSRPSHPSPRDCAPLRRPPAASPPAGLFLSVVDEHSAGGAPDSAGRAQLVKAEWFWASVQNEEAQDEKDYLYKDEESRRSSLSTEQTESPAGASGAASAQLPQRLRKRKFRGSELKEALLNKRRSSVGDAVLLSISGNLLDCTPSPDGKQLLQESEVTDNVVRKLMSPRQQVFMELLQTESNYVGILHTIVTMFKQPLEEMGEASDEEGARDNKTQPLLNNTEIKSIFGNLQPIYELHRRMLEELRHASSHWSEEVSIGRLVLKHTPDMLKAYPPFVNFFEKTKELLQQCDRDNPRFHAFLKRCQSRPECGRQSLQELLIRPVQRLPSVSLLINDILKHTHKNNPDHGALVSALAGLREAMSHINEDKRKTESQMQMFNIFNDIEQCPADLLSSHRSFVARCDVVELGGKDKLSGRGDHLVLFLFTDTMEVCKKRSKVFNSKSPTGSNGTGGTVKLSSSKSFRHISLMPLSTVKRVVDIRESEECHNVFALMCRSNQELQEKLYLFTISDEAVDKAAFLRQLCRQMANTVCKADADKFLACLDLAQLEIDTSGLALGTLSKAFKFASRTRLKVLAHFTLPRHSRPCD